MVTYPGCVSSTGTLIPVYAKTVRSLALFSSEVQLQKNGQSLTNRKAQHCANRAEPNATAIQNFHLLL